MSKWTLKEDEVRIAVRAASRTGGTLYYKRPYVGLTFEEAILNRFDGEDHPFSIDEPYEINGKKIDDLWTVLQQGDLVSVVDP